MFMGSLTKMLLKNYLVEESPPSTIKFCPVIQSFLGSIKNLIISDISLAFQFFANHASLCLRLELTC